MFALTKKTGYGLIAMTYLAKLAAGQLASARDIADRFGVPLSLLMNVLKELSAAGYIESVRGMRGGYRLARSPDQVNLADLVTALEGPIRSSECMHGGVEEHAECSVDMMSRCPLADPVHRVQRKINDFLRKVTLAELVDPIPSDGGPDPRKEISHVG